MRPWSSIVRPRRRVPPASVDSYFVVFKGVGESEYETMMVRGGSVLDHLWTARRMGEPLGAIEAAAAKTG